jgi:hypothetical protein
MSCSSSSSSAAVASTFGTEGMCVCMHFFMYVQLMYNFICMHV